MDFMLSIFKWLQHWIQNAPEFVQWVFSDLGFGNLNVLEFFTIGGLTLFLGLAIVKWAIL